MLFFYDTEQQWNCIWDASFLKQKSVRMLNSVHESKCVPWPPRRSRQFWDMINKSLNSEEKQEIKYVYTCHPMIKLNNKSDTASKNYGIKARIWDFHLLWSNVEKGRLLCWVKAGENACREWWKRKWFAAYVSQQDSVVGMGNYQIKSRPPLFPVKEKNSTFAQLDVLLKWYGPNE